jgi:hypothetical protein
MATTPQETADQGSGVTRILEPVRRGGGAAWALVGAALLLLGVGCVVLSTSFDEPREATALGRNLPVNEGARNPLDLSTHNSPAIATNPRNEENLAIANRIDSPRYSCALQVTFDGGGNWSQTPIPAPRGEEPKCYAPDVAFGPDGTLYLTFATLRGRANAPNAVWTSTSRDGGRTLSTPVKALGKLAFQTRIVADPQRPGRLYLSYLQASDVALYKFTEPGNPIRVIRSEDGGRSWSRPVQVNAARRERVLAPSPAVGRTGELYVLFLDVGRDALDYHGTHRGRGGPPYTGAWQLVLARSGDRGSTWSESLVEGRVVPTERFIAFTPPFPSLAVDRDSGRAYVAFQDGRLGDADVELWTLGSGDRDWTGPKRVNDTPLRDKTSQYLPRLVVAPDGRLDVIYYDRRADPRRNVMNQVSYQSSFDEGQSFTKSVRLSDQAFDSRIGFGVERRLPDLGSRLGLVSTDRRSLAVWADTRAGTRRAVKQDLGQRFVAYNDPPRLSGTVEALLRWGGVLIALVGLALLVGWAAARTRLATS